MTPKHTNFPRRPIRVPSVSQATADARRGIAAVEAEELPAPAPLPNALRRLPPESPDVNSPKKDECSLTEINAVLDENDRSASADVVVLETVAADESGDTTLKRRRKRSADAVDPGSELT